MEKLSGKTRLHRVDDLHVHLPSRGSRLEVRKGGRFTSTGPGGLAVLDAFRKPRTVVGALDALKRRLADRYSWAGAAEDIVRLYRAGFLVDVDQAAPAPTLWSRPDGWDAAKPHAVMLNDRRRTESYLAGGRAVVRPGDVMVDLGTGTGVLAVAAAQAGASRVYAIEAICTAAEAAFRANGYGDRITLIPGVSTDVELPERADVLISERMRPSPAFRAGSRP